MTKQGIAEGELREAVDEDASANGEAGHASMAVHRATALLLDENRVPEDLNLEYLPWLLESSPEESLAVLKVKTMKSSHSTTTDSSPFPAATV